MVDVLVLGGGPGGYVAAIRAAQLGKKVVVVEMDKLGGVCLNRGCIPTKALLKSAHAVHEVKDMASYGVNVEMKGMDATVAIKRANAVADRMSKGVAFLMKKNKIDVISGRGILKGPNTVEVNGQIIEAKHIIVATGAHYKTFPGLVHDGKRLLGAWEALKLDQLPKTMAIIGAGAIGVEFAYFWNAFGVDVTIFEVQSHLLPMEDEESSAELERCYKKYGMKQVLGVKSISARNNGETVTVTSDGVDLEYEMCLIAVGMTGSIGHLGLEDLGVQTEKGFIVVDSFGQTNIPSIYAIGDVAGPPLLAHVASHEGIIAAEHIAGLNPHPIDKSTIPGCTYGQPQVASVGLREKDLKEKGIPYTIGKIPFMANGKAQASNEKDGFIKTLVSESGELLGAHIVGNQATELLFEYVLMKQHKMNWEDVVNTIHAHPTLGELLSETLLASQGRSINF